MRKLICRLIGHEYTAATNRRRSCHRCGLQETLRNLGNVLAWEEVTEPSDRGVRT